MFKPCTIEIQLLIGIGNGVTCKYSLGFVSCGTFLLATINGWLFAGPFLTGIKQNGLLVTFLILDALYFHSYYIATPCFGSCNSHQSVSSIVIYIPSFDLMMFKQVNKDSRMDALFTHRSQFPLKNLKNSTKKKFFYYAV